MACLTKILRLPPQSNGYEDGRIATRMALPQSVGNKDDMIMCHKDGKDGTASERRQRRWHCHRAMVMRWHKDMAQKCQWRWRINVTQRW
eukprot:1158055-Pelagomonas_calceolata.AAC.1